MCFSTVVIFPVSGDFIVLQVVVGLLNPAVKGRGVDLEGGRLGLP